jgi:hypothetical protein
VFPAIARVRQLQALAAFLDRLSRQNVHFQLAGKHLVTGEGAKQMKRCLTVPGLLAALLFVLSSCSSEPYKPVDFLASFGSGRIAPAGANFATPDGKPVFIMKGLTVGDEKRDAIVVLADAKLEFDIPEVPPSGKLTFAAGMGVDRGDGAEGTITVQADGQSAVVYKKFINPVERTVDRHWFEESVDLSKFAGKRIQVVFSTSAGPKGDAIADWFAWANPRLE